MGLVGYSFLAVTVPLLYPSSLKGQLALLEQPGQRTVFTTYFYWYRSGGADFYNSPHVMEYWEQDDEIQEVNGKAGDYPEGWPGPTDVEDMMVNRTAGGGWHDSISEHPPGDMPTINATGDVVGSIPLGIQENMTTWFDWMNQDWHQWEFRSMMKAGIDVAMPVYWWNGVHNYWAYEGLITMVDAWHNLTGKVTDEANLKDGGNRTITYGQSLVPKISMFFDTTCMKQLWARNVSLDNSSEYYGDEDRAFKKGPGPNLNDPYWIERFWYCIDQFYGVVDENATFIWDDSYIVWLYSSGWFEDVGTEVLDYCREQSLLKYGKSLVFIGEDRWMNANADGICPWGACFGPKMPKLGMGRIPCGAVSPGYYNLGAIAIQPPLYHVRDVERYKSEWQSVMNGGALWVHVETWNEYHEGTDISWTQEYGYQWISATRKMADVFHEMIFENFSLWDTANITVVVGATVALGTFAMVIIYLGKAKKQISIGDKR